MARRRRISERLRSTPAKRLNSVNGAHAGVKEVVGALHSPSNLLTEYRMLMGSISLDFGFISIDRRTYSALLSNIHGRRCLLVVLSDMATARATTAQIRDQALCFHDFLAAGSGFAIVEADMSR